MDGSSFGANLSTNVSRVGTKVGESIRVLHKGVAGRVVKDERERQH